MWGLRVWKTYVVSGRIRKKDKNDFRDEVYCKLDIKVVRQSM